MKKLLALLMAGIMLFAFAACGGNGEEETTTNPEEITTEAPANADVEETTAAEEETEEVTEVVTDDEGEAVTDKDGDVVTEKATKEDKTEKPTKDNSVKPTQQSSKKPESKAEIIEYFNKASNKVKTSAKSVTKVREENYQAKDINLGALGMFEGVVNDLINKNMGVNKEQSGRVGTSAADKNAIYPVENESWSSKLTAADVKTAECTEKNGVYTITLTLVNDPLAQSYSHGTGHHGKAFSIVMPQTIKDNAGGAASLLGSLKVGYQDGKIVVNVDAATGNITSAKYDFVWILNVDVFGGVTAYFGIRTDYSMKW
ncbi:MAG: hypothetical protein IJF20_05805 [Clostridia bacterium]|nr:hypothetical protein [Clostridia bacterium]